MSIQKARTLLAKYQAYSNAAEMIRGHGEEGFSFEDKKFNKVYNRETKNVADKLNKKATEYYIAYLKLGIEIECEIDKDY